MMLAFTCAAWAIADTDSDFQLWSYNSVAKKLGKKSTLAVDGEVRFGDNASKAFLWYLQARLRRDLTPNLAIEPAYRHLYFFRPAVNDWQALYEPFVDIHLKTEWKGWTITSRNRPSYLIFDHLPNLWQFRTRLLARAPWKWGAIGVSPVIFDEVFFRERSGFEQNRFALGGSWPFGDGNQSMLVFMLRHRKLLDEWRYQRVIWLLLNFVF